MDEKTSQLNSYSDEQTALNLPSTEQADQNCLIGPRALMTHLGGTNGLACRCLSRLGPDSGQKETDS